MTHVFYTEQQLSVKPLWELKTIYTQIGCNVDVADKRRKHAWMEAIVIHQSSQIQAVAQAELEQYIEEQAAAIAPEEPNSNRITLTTREITFYDHEVLAGEEVVAEIHYHHNDFETQRWVVYISGKEFRRGHTFAKAFGIVCHHHTFDTLPGVLHEENEPALLQRVPDYADRSTKQGLAHFLGDNASPKHQSVQLAETNNTTMAEISAAADEFGLELLDDGIYDGDVKLGEVGYNHGSWWVVRSASLHQEKIPCDSVKEAVWILSNFVPTSPNNADVLLDKPFDELTQQEWKFLKCIDTSALDEIFGMSTVKSFCLDVVTAPLDEVFAVV